VRRASPEKTDGAFFDAEARAKWLPPHGFTGKSHSCGTDLNVAQEGAPVVIPAGTCDLGWREALTLRTQFVEVKILDVERRTELLVGAGFRPRLSRKSRWAERPREAGRDTPLAGTLAPPVAPGRALPQQKLGIWSAHQGKS